eukprot:jgi/Ulvmu1/10280/UM060_0082.1
MSSTAPRPAERGSGKAPQVARKENESLNPDSALSKLRTIFENRPHPPDALPLGSRTSEKDADKDVEGPWNRNLPGVTADRPDKSTVLSSAGTGTASSWEHSWTSGPSLLSTPFQIPHSFRVRKCAEVPEPHKRSTITLHPPKARPVLQPAPAAGDSWAMWGPSQDGLSAFDSGCPRRRLESQPPAPQPPAPTPQHTLAPGLRTALLAAGVDVAPDDAAGWKVDNYALAVQRQVQDDYIALLGRMVSIMHALRACGLAAAAPAAGPSGAAATRIVYAGTGEPLQHAVLACCANCGAAPACANFGEPAAFASNLGTHACVACACAAAAGESSGCALPACDAALPPATGAARPLPTRDAAQRSATAQDAAAPAGARTDPPAAVPPASAPETGPHAALTGDAPEAACGRPQSPPSRPLTPSAAAVTVSIAAAGDRVMVELAARDAAGAPQGAAAAAAAVCTGTAAAIPSPAAAAAAAVAAPTCAKCRARQEAEEAATQCIQRLMRQLKQEATLREALQKRVASCTAHHRASLAAQRRMLAMLRSPCTASGHSSRRSSESSVA